MQQVVLFMPIQLCSLVIMRVNLFDKCSLSKICFNVLPCFIIPQCWTNMCVPVCSHLQQCTCTYAYKVNESSPVHTVYTDIITQCFLSHIKRSWSSHNFLVAGDVRDLIFLRARCWEGGAHLTALPSSTFMERVIKGWQLGWLRYYSLTAGLTEADLLHHRGIKLLSFQVWKLKL